MRLDPYGRAMIKEWNRWRLRGRLSSLLYTLSGVCKLRLLVALGFFAVVG